jgi:tetratricopeptide (TPR) repeat protein
MGADRTISKMDLDEETLSSSTAPPGQASRASVALCLRTGGPTWNFDVEPLVVDHGGTIVGASDSVVVAHFADAKEALKSAIELQREILTENLKLGLEDQIHGRIGIHSIELSPDGSACQAEMVRVASELANSAGTSQILVSQAIYDMAQDFQEVHFEPVNIWHETNVLGGAAIYSIVWDKTTDTRPAKIVLLFVHPLWDLSGNSFGEIWNSMLREGEALWRTKGGNERVLNDGSLYLTLQDETSTLPIAQEILLFLRNGIEKERTQPFIPVHIFIHVRPFAVKLSFSWEDFDIPFPGVEPGDVCISTDARNFVQGRIHVPAIDPSPENPDQSWQKVALDIGCNRGEGEKFLYQEALARGTGEACYYCGSRRHKATECPSKDLSEVTHSMTRLGNLSIEQLNGLFFRFLVAESRDPEKFYWEAKEGLNTPLNYAFFGFYDLNRIFQLRFLGTVWHATSDEWGKASKSRSRNEGGLLWLAQDSLRVSNLARAESILKDAQMRHPDDYRIYCALGLLHVEKGHSPDAEYFFKKALRCSRTNVHKIFALFLLSRLYKILGDPASAYRQVTEILAIDPGCQEAVYQDIVFKFHQGKDRIAMQRLIKLIEDEKEYYIHALIDPEMAPYGDAVNDQLKVMLNGAKEKAVLMVAGTDKEIERSSSLLTKKDLDEIEELRSRVGKSIETGSYFGYLDVDQSSARITTICINGVKERKKEIRGLFEGLLPRVHRALAFVVDYSFPRFVSEHHMQLEQIRERIESIRDLPQLTTLEEFNSYRLAGEDLSDELDQIETRLNKLEIIRQVILNAFKFVRNSIILMALVLFIGIFLFPATVHYINLALAKLDAAPISNVWLYQKSFIVLGGGISLSVSFFITLKNLFSAGPPATQRK